MKSHFGRIRKHFFNRSNHSIMSFQIDMSNQNYDGNYGIKTNVGNNHASRYFPEINDDRSSNPNLSPLNEIIQELKRKNVVASAASGGPQLALDSRSDPWGSSEVNFGIGDDGIAMSFSSSDRAPTVLPSYKSAFGDGQQQRRGQRQQQHFLSEPGRKNSVQPHPQNQTNADMHITHGQEANIKATSQRQKSKLNRWLSSPPPKHAEELLQVTPQLRIISSSSTDMNVAGISTSKNALSMILSSTPFPLHFHPMKKGHSDYASVVDSTTHLRTNIAGLNGKSTAGSSASSTSPSPTFSDYKASLIRDRANHQAASELASLLWICAHEMSLEDYGRVESKTFTSVFALVHSKDDMNRRMAGLAALDALIDAPSADEERKAIKFANTLSGGLRSARGNYEFLSAVSKALGHMATRTANVDFVESEVTRALEWLRTGRSDRR